MSITITNQGEVSEGVEASSIEGSQFSWSHVGWAEQIIHHKGCTYLAAEIVAAVIHRPCRGSKAAARGHHTIKYGPGGRRLYIKVTESLCDEIFKFNGKGGRSTKERARGEEIANFALALLDHV